MENNTKAKIIKTMYNMVAKYGYDKSSIGKISKEIGISKPAIYYYFDSKEDIFLDVIKGLYPIQQGVEKEMLQNISNKADLRRVLLKLGSSLIQGYRGDIERQSFLSEVIVQADRIPRVKKYRGKMDKENFDVWVNILKNAADKGIIDGETILLKAQELFTMSAGISYTIALNEETDTKKIWIDLIDKVIL